MHLLKRRQFRVQILILFPHDLDCLRRLIFCNNQHDILPALHCKSKLFKTLRELLVLLVFLIADISDDANGRHILLRVYFIRQNSDLAAVGIFNLNARKMSYQSIFQRISQGDRGALLCNVQFIVADSDIEVAFFTVRFHDYEYGRIICG